MSVVMNVKHTILLQKRAQIKQMGQHVQVVCVKMERVQMIHVQVVHQNHVPQE